MELPGRNLFAWRLAPSFAAVLALAALAGASLDMAGAKPLAPGRAARAPASAVTHSPATTGPTPGTVTTGAAAAPTAPPTAPPYSCAPNGPAVSQTIYGTFGDASVIGWTGNSEAVAACLGGSFFVASANG